MLADIDRRLASIVGDDHVVTDESEREYYSRDFFFWEGAGTAAVVAAPADVDEVAAVVRAAADADMDVVVRGGGMSTGRSYVPDNDRSVMLDMRRLDRVREINTADRYIVVEAGCTWEQVVKALAPLGWRCDVHAPLSGNVSTVGGLMSHGVPGGLKGVLGLEVVRADGQVLRTGAWGRARDTKPFYREYGPDLTGLFLGDTGAFGIKTAAALHISKAANARAVASFGFESYEDAATVLVALAQIDALTARTMFDPYDTYNVIRVGLAEGLGMLSQTAQASGNLLKGLKDSLRIMREGITASRDACWSVHIAAEQYTQGAADAVIAAASEICLQHGWSIVSPLATASALPLFTVRRIVGKNGERWMATNAIFPISEGPEVVRRTEAFFAERQAMLEKLSIRVGYLSQSTPVHFQCEPLFYWSDALDELHFRHLPKAEHGRLKEIAPNPDARAYVQQMRGELRDFFEELGALHVHTSKFFRYAELFGEEGGRLLGEVKDVLDPGRRLNPGNLGLRRAG